MITATLWILLATGAGARPPVVIAHFQTVGECQRVADVMNRQSLVPHNCVQATIVTGIQK